MNDQSINHRLTVDEINVDRDGQSIATLVDHDGQVVTIPCTLLPDGATVNQVLDISISTNTGAASQRTDRVRRLQHRLFNRESGPR